MLKQFSLTKRLNTVMKTTLQKKESTKKKIKKSTMICTGRQHKKMECNELREVLYENSGQNKLEDHCSKFSMGKVHRMMISED